MATLIFGKIFASMFEGSMYGAGAHVFAVMSFVISHMQPDKEREEHVRLNPAFLAGVIGEPEERITAAIDFLCAPDRKTGSLGASGRRLILVSPYVYHVVNGRYYRELKDEEDRLAKAAVRQKRHRDKKAGKVSEEYMASERRFVEAEKRGDQQAADAETEKPLHKTNHT
jgi:hypothetical protein